VSVLEAMLGGCIPILPDLAVSREWITDGVNGVIEKANTNPLADALTLDIQQCILYNRELVEHKALRSKTILEFINHYIDIIK
jgi:glycosyltransferase involved in cell wall biosynthesis